LAFRRIDGGFPWIAFALNAHSLFFWTLEFHDAHIRRKVIISFRKGTALFAGETVAVRLVSSSSDTLAGRRNFRHSACIRMDVTTGVSRNMSEQQTVVKADQLPVGASGMAAFSQAIGNSLSRTGAWAVDTAQQSGSVVSVLMGPAVFSVYAFAAWSLTSEMGWTDSFPFASGPLSNWIIWTGLAVSLHLAASILRRQKGRE
jgi:hypothetical protein